MGKKGKSCGGGGGGGGRRGDLNHRRTDRTIRSDADIAADNTETADGEDSDEEFDKSHKRAELSVQLYMWEFGQNDPKRDSGSKMVRQGYAQTLRLGKSFAGVVLSSSAKKIISQADAECIAAHGIGGINCSWNRLDEIPFDNMGKSRNHRLLPLLLAANSVNYGKPFKMNTAEATAACLYIAGFKDDAAKLMQPFSYGMEFIRLNYEALEAYSACKDDAEVRAVQEEFVQRSLIKKAEKQQRQELTKGMEYGQGYMDDMDLPPQDSENEYEDYEDCDNVDYVDDSDLASTKLGNVDLEDNERGHPAVKYETACAVSDAEHVFNSLSLSSSCNHSKDEGNEGDDSLDV